MAQTNNIAIAIILGMGATTGAACVDGATASGDDATASGDDAPASGDDAPAGGTGTPEDPVPPASEPVFPTAHPRIYLTPNRTRLNAALAAATPAATRFKSKVDSWIQGEDIWGFQAWNGALLGQLSGEAKYCTKAVSVVESQVVAAEAQIAASQAPEVAHDSYLQVGEMLGDLALVYDWCFDQTSSGQRTRWINYANQAISNVWNPTTAKWGSKVIPWSGWSVNNPSNNYYYSFLRATMLVGLATRGENPQADAWLTQFRVTKILGQLIPTFNKDLVGGASREGTGYGVAMRRLYELYSFWKETTGENLAVKTPHSRASMLAFIHQIVPTLDKVAPTGDHARDASAALFDYHRDYLQELMALFPTDRLASRAKALLAASSVKMMSSAFMVAYDFLNDNADIKPTPLDGLDTTYHAIGIGELYARSGWDTGATWVNLIAGPYTESHAHQDQGSIMIYKGAWLAYDSNINSRSGLSQATTSHSLVRIDSGGAPVRQIANTISTMVALHKGAGYVYASADLTPSYNHDAAVQKVNRELLFLEPNVVIVFDRVNTASGTTQTWQLASPVSPAISGNQATFTNAGHSLAVTRIAPSAGAMSIYNFASDAGFTGGFRLDERVAGGENQYLHVMSVDGAVSSAQSTGTAAQPGVIVNLANGKQATVAFNRDTAGATLTMNGTTIKLAAGVDTLPE